MKYVLLFGETKERAKQWESMPEAQRQAAYAPINQWFEKYGNKITGGHEVQTERTATNVKFNNSRPGGTDGPLIEGKEASGGHCRGAGGGPGQGLAMAEGGAARWVGE